MFHHDLAHTGRLPVKSTGVAEFRSSGIDVNRYPNPGLSAWVLRVEGDDRADLFDCSGRRVLELKPGDNDLRNLPSGVYILQAGTDRRLRKVVIVR